MVSPVVPGGAQPLPTPGQPGATEQAGTAEQRPSDNAPQPANAALAENQDSEQDPRAQDREDTQDAARNLNTAGEDNDSEAGLPAEQAAADFDPNSPRGSVLDLTV